MLSPTAGPPPAVPGQTVPGQAPGSVPVPAVPGAVVGLVMTGEPVAAVVVNNVDQLDRQAPSPRLP